MKIRQALFSMSLLAAPWALGCGTSGGDDAAPPPPVATVAPPPPPTAPPPARTMGTARAMATPVDNLLYDPTFSTLGNPMAFAAYAENGTVEVPALGPAGPSTPVLVTPGGTGNASQVVLLGQGGRGPIEARLFIADDGSPVDAYLVSLVDMSAAYLLERAPASADQKLGDRTYRLHHVRVDGPLFGGIALLVDVSGVKKEIAIAAPEVRAPSGGQTMSARAKVTPVSLGAAARAAIAHAVERRAPPVPVPRRPPAAVLGRGFESPLYGRTAQP